MTYCESKLTATVDYSFKGIQESYISENPPIKIETVTKVSSCWRFSGQGVHNDSYFELFASGDSPSFQGSPGNLSEGLSLFLDGIMLGGEGYVYRNGTQSVEKVDRSFSTPGYITSGSCGATNCSIKITDKTGNVFQKSGDCPLKYSVRCNDDCPEGFCKIDCPIYPGYCCINEAEIKSLMNQLNS